MYDIKLPKWKKDLHGIFYETPVLSNTDKTYSRFIYGEFVRLLDDPRYSFYIAMYLPTTSEDKFGYPVADVIPLIEMNKEEWNKDIQKYSQAVKKRYSLDVSALKDVPRSAFIYALHKKTRDFIGITSDASYGGTISGPENVYQRMKQIPHSGRTRILIDAAITQYLENGNTEFSGVKCESPYFLSWLDFIFSVPDKKQLPNFKAFLAYLDSQSAFQDVFADIVMALLIADGYTFDETNGAYVLDDFGKTALDYIIRHPCELTVAHVKTLQKGGNTKLISKLMEQHKTAAQWDKLFESEK